MCIHYYNYGCILTVIKILAIKIISKQGLWQHPTFNIFLLWINANALVNFFNKNQLIWKNVDERSFEIFNKYSLRTIQTVFVFQISNFLLAVSHTNISGFCYYHLLLPLVPNWYILHDHLEDQSGLFVGATNNFLHILFTNYQVINILLRIYEYQLTFVYSRKCF